MISTDFEGAAFPQKRSTYHQQTMNDALLKPGTVTRVFSSLLCDLLMNTVLLPELPGIHPAMV